MSKEKIKNQGVECEDKVKDGDGYPSCEGEPCANVSDEDETAADNMAESGDESGVEAGADDCESADKVIAEWQDKYLRLQAEFDNYRKRTLKEKMALVESGGEKVLKTILPLRDDVERAVEAMDKSDDIEALRKGVRLISQKFTDTLAQNGVKEIESVGQELDVDHHEAVAKFAAGEDKKGKIIDVVQRGYMLGDKVLRFAKVVVGE